jgi:TonB family protein
VNVLRPTLPATVASVLRTKTRIQVKVHVDAAGKVVSAEPVGGSATTQVPASYVVSAARYWRFEPARRDGVPVPAEVTVNVDFEAGGK